MKAIAIRQYGGPEAVEYLELPDPKVGPDSVLVRVRAAGVNPVDWKIREGYLDTAMDVYFPLVMGWDVAGWWSGSARPSPSSRPGDEVVGYVRKDAVEHGTYAELRLRARPLPGPQAALAGLGAGRRAAAGRADRLPGAGQGAEVAGRRDGTGARARPAASAASRCRSRWRWAPG